jgi:hypothetical protein
MSFHPSSYISLLDPELSMKIASPQPTINPMNFFLLDQADIENKEQNLKIRKLTRQKNTDEEHIVTPAILRKSEKIEKKLEEMFDRKKKERSNEVLMYYQFFSGIFF